MTNETRLAICTAPRGGCGFRGRDWRRGQPIAKYSVDQTPLCFCGSEMIPSREKKAG